VAVEENGSEGVLAMGGSGSVIVTDAETVCRYNSSESLL